MYLKKQVIELMENGFTNSEILPLVPATINQIRRIRHFYNQAAENPVKPVQRLPRVGSAARVVYNYLKSKGVIYDAGRLSYLTGISYYTCSYVLKTYFDFVPAKKKPKVNKIPNKLNSLDKEFKQMMDKEKNASKEDLENEIQLLERELEEKKKALADKLRKGNS